MFSLSQSQVPTEGVETDWISCQLAVILLRVDSLTQSPRGQPPMTDTQWLRIRYFMHI